MCSQLISEQMFMCISSDKGPNGSSTSDLHTTRGSVYSILCTVHSIHCTLYPLQCEYLYSQLEMTRLKFVTKFSTDFIFVSNYYVSVFTNYLCD